MLEHDAAPKQSAVDSAIMPMIGYGQWCKTKESATESATASQLFFFLQRNFLNLKLYTAVRGMQATRTFYPKVLPPCGPDKPLHAGLQPGMEFAKLSSHSIMTRQSTSRGSTYSSRHCLLASGTS